ncbi:S8 family peptidase [Thalassospira xiamenensis]|uniref:S8 family peptidase n=1 Tax=Thalassospira xiamenensis TaxID=220697 RepID=UPI000DED71E1|nr:S8 family peptidase [Thalassospira xiamenensis]RCK41910.1 peptidase S8 and S53, subtilisin, kexin, sedolisin [Thalassospira xiamenensis]
MKRNFLLGSGEKLTSEIMVKSSGGPKEPPYSFAEAKARLSPMATRAINAMYALPSKACPNDEAIVSFTLNPEYIAKSYFPSEILRDFGGELVGSRPKQITPEKRSRNRPVIPTLTTELFVKARRSVFANWGAELPSRPEGTQFSKELIYIEKIQTQQVEDKVKGGANKSDISSFEVVLHANEIEATTHVLNEFGEYLNEIGIDAAFSRRFYAKGLCFIELQAPNHRVTDIATFSLVRAVRQMPQLRMLRPPIRATSQLISEVELPDSPALSSEIRVAVFDGGVPSDHAVCKWVTPYYFRNMAAPTPDFLDHGVAVTSAVLFGHIDPTKGIQRPYTNVDHYRVIDGDPNQNPHELYEVLNRIDNVLSSEEYDFINLSIGPRLPVEDDDVHAWTAVLDDRLASSGTLAAIAVGNDGEGDDTLGLNRVQVPADCVNALSVGACNSHTADWSRAPYSSVGPGRSPGIIKPDLVDFGGVLEKPFIVLASDNKPTLTPTAGTSFATPSVIRLASGVRAHFGSSVTNLGVRALLVHTSVDNGLERKDVGWGRVAQSIDEVTLCDDDTIRVLYQGTITPTKYIRAPIPFPDGVIDGFVSIKATICYKTPVDPHHPGNYTRAGLEATFRPHSGKFKDDKQLHPNSESFFGSATSGITEVELRNDAWKWENCLNAVKRKRGSSLQDPCFDIHYNARFEGGNSPDTDPLDYALVVTVQTKSVSDLYDQVVRKYSTHIRPLQPVFEIPINPYS